MNAALTSALLIGLGGFFGTLARYGLSMLLSRYSVILPMGTLACNMAGCFLIAVIMQLLDNNITSLPPQFKVILATGFCGGFTTMSSMMYETSKLAKQTGNTLAFSYIGMTLIGCAVALWAGTNTVMILQRVTTQ